MSILQKILDTKPAEVERARARRSLDELERACADVSPPRGFARALKRAPQQRIRAIAEIKRASPSAGPIRPDADPERIAREYESAGAAAISVLTDEMFFDGKLSFLTAARAQVALPVLRKDFIVSPYQVVEARAAGADAVLLIVAALDDALLSELFAEVARLGMDALVEVHDEAEAERALAAGAKVVGVNHRNLATFTIDLGLTGRLRSVVPNDIVLVGESGIRTVDSVHQLESAGADAMLVGEQLMRAPSPGVALADLLEPKRP